MAGRKSKYFSSENIPNKKTWSAALYIRLSQEDEDNGKEKQESNSVTSQKTLLNEYVEEHDDIAIYDIYIDDGFTGTDFNRPSFQRLLKDMKNGYINTIIVKDLSRLGRNYIEVGNYIEQVFPVFNIRFIAINDGIDSCKKPESTNTILLPFKNLINDEYARDTSVKIRSSLNGKKKKGEFVGGYTKNPKDKHKLLIDNSVSNIVKKIFEWYVDEGIGKIAICHRLNDLGIPNPSGHKIKELEQNYKNSGIQDDSYNWTPSTIRKILSNEVYIGNTVQGKRKTKSYKIHQLEAVPEEEWIRVENTHEAIIDKDVFFKAQNLSKRDMKISQKTKELSNWAGILKCADCNRAMNKKSSTNSKGTKYEYYICSTYREKSNRLCTKHTIKVENLDNTVLQIINLHISRLINIDEIIKEANRINRKFNSDNNIKNMICSKEKEIDKAIQYKRKLYEDWKNDYITKEEYIDYKRKYDNDIEKNRKYIDELRKVLKKDFESDCKDKYLNDFKREKGFSKLSRNIITELIDSIYVHENSKVTIKFNFAKE